MKFGTFHCPDIPARDTGTLDRKWVVSRLFWDVWQPFVDYQNEKRWWNNIHVDPTFPYRNTLLLFIQVVPPWFPDFYTPFNWEIEKSRWNTLYTDLPVSDDQLDSFLSTRYDVLLRNNYNICCFFMLTVSTVITRSLTHSKKHICVWDTYKNPFANRIGKYDENGELLLNIMCINKKQRLSPLRSHFVR